MAKNIKNAFCNKTAFALFYSKGTRKNKKQLKSFSMQHMQNSVQQNKKKVRKKIECKV